MSFGCLSRAWRAAATTTTPQPLLCSTRRYAVSYAAQNAGKSNSSPSTQEAQQRDSKKTLSQGLPQGHARTGQQSPPFPDSTHVFFNRELPAFCKTYDIAPRETYIKLRDYSFGLKASYSPLHNFSFSHISNYLTTSHPLTAKYLSMYREKKKNPLWSWFNDIPGDVKPYVRETAKKKCRRAFLSALKAAHYRPNGKALAVDELRDTELHGTVKITLLDARLTAQANMSELITHFAKLLDGHVIPKLRRKVSRRSKVRGVPEMFNKTPRENKPKIKVRPRSNHV